MLKKSITYENPFTGLKTTEDFHFHISKADIVRMNVEEHAEKYEGKDGEKYEGMQAKLMRIMDAQDGKAMMPMFEDIIKRSFGRKDGDRFMRTEEIWQDFRGSGAYEELLFILCTDAEQSAEFINSIFPSNMQELAVQIQADNEAKAKGAAKPKKRAAKKSAEEPTVPFETSERSMQIAGATVEKPVALTQAELADLEPEDLQTGLASGKFTISAPESFVEA